MGVVSQIKGMPDLNASLDEYFKSESLHGSNQYRCAGKCKTKQNAERRTVLRKLPPVLNLQLLRFAYDPETLRKRKVQDGIKILEQLRLPFYPTSDTEQPQYAEYACVVLIDLGCVARQAFSCF